MADIAYIVKDSGSPDATNDVIFYDRMTSTLGHTVTYIDDSVAEATDFTDYDAIVVSRSIDTDSLLDGLKATVKPILFHRRTLTDDYGLGDQGLYHAGQSQVNIVDNTHYITSPYDTGNLTVQTQGYSNDYFTGWANDVNDLAQDQGQATYCVIAEIDIDETLADSTTAAERRVFFGIPPLYINSDGLILFDRSVGWCLGEDSEGEAHTKNLTETLTITGAVTGDFTKEVVETMTLTDVIAHDFDKVLTESMTITDVITQAFTKALTESMTITGVILAAIGEHFTVNLTETLTITDSLHKILYDLSVFDPVTVVQVILYSNWNETTVGRPTIRSFVKREIEQGIIKRWNYLTQGDLIGISETGFVKTPHSAGYDYTTTVIKVKLNIGTAKGRTHLFAVFDELRRCLHLKRGEPTSAYTSWRPLIVTNRTIHYDKYKKLWKMDVFVELREKCYALA